MFIAVVYPFTSVYNRSADRKESRSWQKQVLNTQEKLAITLESSQEKQREALNQIENTMIIISQNITEPRIDKSRCEIILKLWFKAHRYEKLNWLREHYNEENKIKSDIDKKILKDKMQEITLSGSCDVDNFRTEYGLLGTKVWNEIDWERFIPALFNIMTDKMMSLKNRLQQADELMTSHLTKIKVEILKNKQE